LQVTPPSAQALRVRRDVDGVPVIDDEIGKLFRHLVVWQPYDDGPCGIGRALTPVERAALQTRAAVLEIALQHYDHEEEMRQVDTAISAMFSGFRSMRQQGDDAEFTVAITRGALRDFPAWAIVRGCLNIATNKAGLDRRFAPNDVEIVDVVAKVLRPYRSALSEIKKILGAKVERA
jgi:hypothetical protein